MATSKKTTRSSKTTSAKPTKATAKKTPATKKTAAVKTPVKTARTRAKPVRTQDDLTRLRAAVQKALEDIKARDIHEMDVRDKASFTDVIYIVSGTSTRHVKSIADEVAKQAKQAGFRPLGIEGEREAEWILVDLGDVIVHAMLPRTREFYGLERLWSVGDDAPLEAISAG